MTVGIVAYGISLPTRRIDVREITRVWHNMDESSLKRMLGIVERGVLQADEDSITLSADAATKALESCGLGRGDVGALYLGTQTSPYVSRPSSSVIAEMCGLSGHLFCGDCQFSGKSGTMALQIVASMVRAGLIKYGLAIGSDALCLHAAPGDPFEYSASAGAVAFIIGSDKLIVEIEDFASWVTDTPDFFRLDGDRYISSGGQSMTSSDLGLPKHIRNSVQQLLGQTGTTAAEYKYVVTQQPNGVLPLKVGTSLGFGKEKVAPGLVADRLGDCGAASSLIGLAKVLDNAEPGERILLVSYGAGAGSDAFSLKTLPNTGNWKPKTKVSELLEKRVLVDYATMAKFERKYHVPEGRISAFA